VVSHSVVLKITSARIPHEPVVPVSSRLRQIGPIGWRLALPCPLWLIHRSEVRPGQVPGRYACSEWSVTEYIAVIKLQEVTVYGNISPIHLLLTVSWN